MPEAILAMFLVRGARANLGSSVVGRRSSVVGRRSSVAVAWGAADKEHFKNGLMASGLRPFLKCSLSAPHALPSDRRSSVVGRRSSVVGRRSSVAVVGRHDLRPTTDRRPTDRQTVGFAFGFDVWF